MTLSRHANRAVDERRTSLANDNSVPGSTQTATSLYSDAAKPLVPVPKSRVMSLSPTFADRDFDALKAIVAHFRPPIWDSPSAQPITSVFDQGTSCEEG